MDQSLCKTPESANFSNAARVDQQRQITDAEVLPHVSPIPRAGAVTLALWQELRALRSKGRKLRKYQKEK
jgi:hypothetical protein